MEMSTVMETSAVMSTNETSMSMEIPALTPEECLKERKWWSFLIYSVLLYMVNSIFA